MRTTIVIKLTGDAIWTSELEVDTDYLRGLAARLGDLATNFRCGITVGGGSLARRLIGASLALGESDGRSSALGGDAGLIAGRLLNASLRSEGLKTLSAPTSDFGIAEEALEDGRVPVLCGWWPAVTSDTVAAQFADQVRAAVVVKLSKVDAIYDSDPARCEAARPKHALTHLELRELCVQGDDRRAGSSFVVDVVTAKILERTHLPLRLFSYQRLDLLGAEVAAGAAVSGTDGTLVKTLK